MNNGRRFTTMLTLIFVIFKLAGIVDWSWSVVFAPIFISIGIKLLIVLFLLVILIAKAAYNNKLVNKF